MESADAHVQCVLDPTSDDLGPRRHLDRRVWIQECLGTMGLSGLSWFPCLPLVCGAAVGLEYVLRFAHDRHWVGMHIVRPCECCGFSVVAAKLTLR